jgi:(p)ppGpp synthase/HD superfamily hydrolase
MKPESDLRKAFNFMVEAHDGVKRKFSGLPYAHHPVAVAQIVRNKKQSHKIDKLVIAALLHDTVEDVDHITSSTIYDEFGEIVGGLVYELTSDPKGLEKMGKKDYLATKMTKMTSWALVIKLADRLHNCSDLSKGSEKFRQKYVSETRYIIDYLRQHRYLSDTHKDLINLIENRISKYEN